jgi:hypothetical protein
MSPVIVAAIAAVVILALVMGKDMLEKLFSDRARLIREDSIRQDAADAQNRARAEHERDLSYVAAVFDPLKLFH